MSQNHSNRDNWTSLNTRMVRSVALAGLILVAVSIFSLSIIYERYLQRELANRAETLVLHAEAVTGLVEFREDLEWHLVSLQQEFSAVEALTIVDADSGEVWMTTKGPASATAEPAAAGSVRRLGDRYTFALPFAPDLNSIVDVNDVRLTALATLNASTLKAEVWRDLAWFIVILVAGVGGIAFLTYLLIRHRVLIPLRDIGVALENQDQSILEATSARKDEVGDVARLLKQPLLQLQESLDRLQSILDHVADGILALDSDGRIRSLNGAAERIFDRNANEVHGNRLVDLVSRDPNGPVLRLPDMIGERRECVITRKDGELVPVELAVNSVTSANELMFTAVIRDISAWKKNQELLIESRQRAEQVANAKSEFLATMSHEIRTPMNGVLGMSQLLLDMDITSEQRETARLIHSSAESLLSLINDILDFSKVEAGKLDFESLTFDLREGMQEVVELMAAQAHSKGLQIAVDYKPDVPSLLVGDLGRVRQVLVNLIGNAIKFSERGRVSMTVVDRDSDHDQARLKVSIRDAGIGIPDEIQATLFKPFTQADATMSRRFGGTGLGLAICYQLVESMGGTIGVNSEPGVGSDFWFTLNLPRGTVVDGDNRQASGVTSVVVTRSYKGIRVLLAEDNVVNQKVARRMLAKLECRIDVAANGNEAISMWQELPYDLVFMDCQMPGLDGLEATCRIRDMERTLNRSRTPIVALTANAMEADRRACLRAGMDDYLSKPIKFQLVVQIVEKWCGGMAGPASRVSDLVPISR